MGIPGFTGGQVPGFSAMGRAQRETQRPQQGQGWALQLPEPRARPRPCPLAPAAGGPQHRLRALPARSSAPWCCRQPGTPGDAQSRPPVWRAPRSARPRGRSAGTEHGATARGPGGASAPLSPAFATESPSQALVVHGLSGGTCPTGSLPRVGLLPCRPLPAAACCRLSAPHGAVLCCGTAQPAPSLQEAMEVPQPLVHVRALASHHHHHHITSHHITTSHRHRAPAPVSVCPGCSRAR